MVAEPKPQDCATNWPGCACPKDISELHITPPDGMKLVGGDNCSAMGDEITMGTFEFAGDVTVTGTILYRYNDMFDRSDASFEAQHPHRNRYTEAQYNQFASGIDYFGMYENPHPPVPPVSDANPCQAAPAVMRIRHITIVVSGQDDAGAFATDYDVVKVGEYRKCTPR
jgi:hypothetical protein